MITQFPGFYQDELVYSLLARYYSRTGYPRYIFAAEELLDRPNSRLDPEFVNGYTKEAMKAITRYVQREEVIQSHTMFPYYGRFLPWERRKKAFDSLVNMRGGHRNLLALPPDMGKLVSDSFNRSGVPNSSAASKSPDPFFCLMLFFHHGVGHRSVSISGRFNS